MKTVQIGLATACLGRRYRYSEQNGIWIAAFDMTEIRNEQRKFTRVALDLPVDVHQGGSVWQLQLIELSLGGAATTQPDVWDAQYNEPFTLIIKLADGDELELYAYLQHVDAKRLGFSVQHVDRENIQPLRDLLEQHMDIATLEMELARLDDSPK